MEHSVVEFAKQFTIFVAQDMQIKSSVLESAEEFTIFVAIISASRKPALRTGPTRRVCLNQENSRQIS